MESAESMSKRLNEATVEELEAMWMDTLQEFMERIGVPERFNEAVALVRREPTWTELRDEWENLPVQFRETRYANLMDTLNRAGYATRPECLRSGECCRKSSPSLFLDDLRLFTDNIIKRSQVYTVRQGETVRVPLDMGTTVLKHETIKVGENPETGDCLFFDGEEHACSLYDDRPIQCRAQACWDTSDIEDLLENEDRLCRAHVLNPEEPVAKFVVAHESHCSMRKLAGLFEEIRNGDEKALDSIFEALAFDSKTREIILDNKIVPVEDLPFILGHHLPRVITMFGVRVETGEDGTSSLVPIVPNNE